MSSTCASTSGKVSSPSDGVRVPSAIVGGLCTVCRVPVRNDRVASSASLGLDADHAAAGATAPGRERAAREQAAAAAGDEQRIEIGCLFVQLQRRRALSGDDVRVIERRNQRQPCAAWSAAATASRDSVAGS